MAAMLGHTPLRIYAMGPAAGEREANEEEIDQMCRLLTEALAAGAIGFSSSQAPSHIGPTGGPVPSRLASREEIRRLLAAMGTSGRGIAEITYGPRYEIQEVAALSKELGVRITWGSLLTSLFGGHGAALELLERGSAVGGDLWPQVSCRLIVTSCTLEDPNHFSLAPAFKQVFAAPREDRPYIYRNPAWRARVRAELPEYRPVWWDQVWVSESERFAELRGQTLADLAAARGADPLDLLFDMALQEDLKTRFKFVTRNGDREELAALLTDRRTLLGAHDAGAHVDQLCDAVFPTYLLSRWVRDEKAMTLEEAVWRLSGQPASVFRIPGRGLIREGYAADLVAFDADAVAPLDAVRVHDFPAGADRLVAGSTGVEHVWVNGTPTRRRGAELAGVTPGVLVS